MLPWTLVNTLPKPSLKTWKPKIQQWLLVKNVFKLYDTSPVPSGIDKKKSWRAGMTVDREGLQAAMKEQQNVRVHQLC